jgi:hypothetical protein
LESRFDEETALNDDQEPPSGDGGSPGGEGTPPEEPAIEEPPPYKPDPDLITFLEREAKPGEVKVWHPGKDE